MKTLNIKILALALVVGLSFTLSGCNASNTQKGAGIGVAGGALIGGLIGGKNNAALGAIIGAAVGGTAGGLIGNKMDKQAEAIQQTLPGAEVNRTQEGIQVILDENSDVRFEYNKSDLTQQAKTNLDNLVTIFKEYPDTDILIVGHTDNVGSDAYNQPLSEKRAQSVVTYLISKGVNSSRLSSAGKGKTEPRVSNDTDAGRAQNRRVEFAITANEKMIDDAKKEAGEL